MKRLDYDTMMRADINGLERLAFWLGLDVKIQGKARKHALIAAIQREEKRLERLPKDRTGLKKSTPKTRISSGARQPGDE